MTIRQDRTLDEALAQGFFSDRVVEAICRVYQTRTISPEDRGLLQRVREALESARRGGIAIHGGNIRSTSVQDIGAYRLVLHYEIESKSKNPPASTIGKMDNELASVLNAGITEKGSLETTREFYNFVRHETIRRSGAFFREDFRRPSGFEAY